MDSSSLSSITAHDAGSKYFLSMYTSTRTRIFACFVGSTAGCFLVGLREARVREGLKAPLKAAFDVLSVIFSYLFLTKCVFGDLKVQEEEWTENGYTKVRFLVWTRVNYSLLCGCLLLSLGGSSVMSPNSSSPPLRGPFVRSLNGPSSCCQFRVSYSPPPPTPPSRGHQRTWSATGGEFGTQLRATSSQIGSARQNTNTQAGDKQNRNKPPQLPFQRLPNPAPLSLSVLL